MLDGPLPEDYDIVMCSLFLHHLDDEMAVDLLSKMAAAARRLVVVNDLRRSTIGYLLAWLGCRLLTRSPVVHVDGPRSVQAAFSLDEIRSVLKQSGLKSACFSRAGRAGFSCNGDRHELVPFRPRRLRRRRLHRRTRDAGLRRHALRVAHGGTAGLVPRQHRPG